MKPKYAIINDVDAPVPSMVCQWVPKVGYCYMKREGGHEKYDGMAGGASTTPVENFGWAVQENPDGTVSFYRNGKPSFATYHDGSIRRWQHSAHSFEHRRLTVVKGKVVPVAPKKGKG
jgi:hypothetical protein